MGRPPKHVKFSRPVENNARPADERERIINFDILDEETKALITAKALRNVSARDIEEAEDAFLKAEMARLEKEKHPELAEEERTITLDLPLLANELRIDNKVYAHGRTYTVKKSLYDVMQETIQAMKRHLDEIQSGDPSNAFYLKERNAYTASLSTGQAFNNGRPVRF